MGKSFLIEAYETFRRRLGRGVPQAEEDALGEAFCRLWCAGYEPATAEEGERLLYTAAHRRQISLWRSERRHPSVPLADVHIAEQPPEYDIDDTLLRINNLVRSELTPIQQDILTRHDMGGEPYSEIAKSLGMQEAAVRMQLSRARRKIRDIYRMRNEE